MMNHVNKKVYRILICGGGTGGHIFPAIAIANEIKKVYPMSEVLFVGSNRRMEMQKVPEAGYSIIGIEIEGIHRNITWKNILFPYILFKGMINCRKIIKDFKPDLAIGVGGYVSGPILFLASMSGIKTLILEQNSYPGLTNKILGRFVDKICVAYEDMEKYFPKNKIEMTGNPVKKEMLELKQNKQLSKELYGFNPERKILLVMGGSLGAKTINESIQKGLNEILKNNIQVIWQTGEKGYESIQQHYQSFIKNTSQNIPIVIQPFFKNMEQLYSMADLVISRAGALSVSELSVAGKPVILIPSPNVAEDHQTRNAMKLVEMEAAVLIKDNEAIYKLADKVIELINDELKLKSLSSAILKFAIFDSTERIIKEVEKLLITN